MKILVGRVFGIGNAVLSIPLLKSLRILYPQARLDVLLGNTQDDVGNFDVIKQLTIIDNIYFNFANDVKYDVAIMAIPFDDRWRNEVNFVANDVLDCRPRPEGENRGTHGLNTWKKHEVEYQMENVYKLGYLGKIPNCNFLHKGLERKKSIYLGFGYKKDVNEQWKIKHWSNENYAKLINTVCEIDNDITFFTTGDFADIVMSINPCHKLVKRKNKLTTYAVSLENSFNVINSCGIYIGNDTGMMHVAAACNLKVLSLFFMENSVIKSHPWDCTFTTIDAFNRDLNVNEVVDHLMRFL